MSMSEYSIRHRYITVKQVPSYYPIFKESYVRALIKNGRTNGFNACMRKLGRKILIDMDALDKWIDSHRV